MKRRDLTEEDEKQVLELYNSGMSGVGISVALKLPKGKVYALLSEQELIRPKGVQPLSDEIKQKIRDVYLSGYSTEDTGIMLGVSQSSVSNVIIEFGISRGSREGQLLKSRGIGDTRKNQAIKLYQSGIGPYEISKQLKVGSDLVYKWIAEEGIEIRGRSESMKLYRKGHDISGENHPMYGKHHSEETKKKISDAAGGKVTVTCAQCDKTRQIPRCRYKPGKDYFCNYTCRNKWMESHNVGACNPNWKGGSVEVRCTNCGEIVDKEQWELKREFSIGMFCNKKCEGEFKSEHYRGENNPNYVDGNSYGDYCPKWTESLRERVRWFFADKHGVRRCFLCGKSEEDNKVKLSVHHVDYDKSTCCNDKVPYLVPLCHDCHCKTSGKNVRSSYENQIKERLVDLTGGKCYFTKEEYKEFRKKHPKYF